MSAIPCDLTVRSQYRTDQNLKARIELHARFSTNPYPWQRWVFDHLAIPKRARVLELGCGPATLWAGNLDRIPEGWDVILTDLSAGMIASAVSALGRAACSFGQVVADAQAIPFRGRCFDAVIANHMLYHVPDRRRALAEIARVLAPAGALYATTVGEEHMAELWALLDPEIPDIASRQMRVSRAFMLENGADQLRSVFATVRRYDYEDGLAITEAAPAIAYLRSSSTVAACGLTPDQWDAVHARVEAEIAAHGAFRVRKASGLFVAQGRLS